MVGSLLKRLKNLLKNACLDILDGFPNSSLPVVQFMTSASLCPKVYNKKKRKKEKKTEKSCLILYTLTWKNPKYIFDTNRSSN